MCVDRLSAPSGQQGEEKARIERPGGSSSPVWCVHFSPVREEAYDVLAVADWGQTLSFYSVYTKDFKVAEVRAEPWGGRTFWCFRNSS